MKQFKKTTICKLAKVNKLKNDISFVRKGIKYNVVYSTDLDKWYLNTTNSRGKYITIGEIK